MAQPETFPVCRGCGLVAPSHQGECAHCGTATGEQAAWVPFRSDGYFSVAILMQFRCRACGHLVPANYLDLDGSLGCARCGIEQAFAPERFRDVLLAAHDVGDLAGPHPEGHPAHRTEPIGRDNRYGGIGRTQPAITTTLRRRNDTDLEVRLELTRGRRLCTRCQMPVELYPDGQGGVTTLCSYCQDRAQYGLPPGARELYPSLLGVVADEHRSDCQRSETVSSEGDAAVAIQCPSCHAPLRLSPTSALAHCPYCSTDSVIPARAWARAGGDDPSPQPWFALFHGPSSARKRLAMEAAMERSSRERGRVSGTRAAPAEPAQAAQKKRFPLRTVLLGLVLVVGLATLLYVQIFDDLIQANARPGKRKSGEGRASGAKPKRRTPPPRSAFEALEYCSCLTELDGKGGLESVTLANHVEYDDGGKLRLEIYLDVEGLESRYLSLGAKTAPPAHPPSSAIAIGMACDGKVVALISGHYATGWSATSGKKLWTKKIAGSYDHPNPKNEPGKFATWCEQMQPKQGKVSLNVGTGKKLQVRVADGQLTMP